MQPESRRVKKIKAYLKGRGDTHFYKIHGGDNYQVIGIPDLLCCVRGRFVALEVKEPGEQPSKKQVLELQRIRDAGGVSAVVETVSDVVELLANI